MRQLTFYGERRYEQLSRVLTVAELLCPLRSGASIQDLHRDVCDLWGHIHERTVRRDCWFLESIGLIERLDAPSAISAHTQVRWLGGNIKARAVEEMTIAFGESQFGPEKSGF